MDRMTVLFAGFTSVTSHSLQVTFAHPAGVLTRKVVVGKRNFWFFSPPLPALNSEWAPALYTDNLTKMPLCLDWNQVWLQRYGLTHNNHELHQYPLSVRTTDDLQQLLWVDYIKFWKLILFILLQTTPRECQNVSSIVFWLISLHIS